MNADARPSSYWIASTPEPGFPALDGRVDVDVAVLGGGITGISAATLLKRAGKTVALVEMKQLVHGATGYTTAKVTSGHNLIYAELRESFGAEGARLYAEANEGALALIGRLIDEMGISCDFERRPNVIYTESEDVVPKLEEELDAARAAGLDVSLTRQSGLPFPVAAALRLERQAQFHPRAYLLRLAAGIPGDGSHVFEHTRALDVEEGDPCVVTTDRGQVRARDVILATHLPFEDKGGFFAKSHPSRSYVVAGRVDADRAPDGMFISADPPDRSVRTAPYDGGTLLIVGGEGHKTGQHDDTRTAYARLEDWARERFGVDATEFRWSTQDYVSVDRVPFVGPLAPGSEHVWVATAYGKWGMTNGTVAAMILTDLISGRENRWADLYDATRLRSLASADLVKENLDVAKRWFADRLSLPGADTLGTLAPGEGTVVRADGEAVAVSRDASGRLVGVSATCTHMGCVVSWNRAEQTWDCPCHGSRFLPDGTVIQGPAVKDLGARHAPDAG